MDSWRVWLITLAISSYFIWTRIPKYFNFLVSSYVMDYWAKRQWLFVHILTGLIATLCALA